MKTTDNHDWSKKDDLIAFLLYAIYDLKKIPYKLTDPEIKVIAKFLTKKKT